MTVFKSDFLNVLQSRGFIHQISDPDSLDALAARRELVAYIGFDCTAPSLHVGSMVQIMCLYWLQQSGNKPIALMGGGTTRVGDPSGKDETRKILSIEAKKAVAKKSAAKPKSDAVSKARAPVTATATTSPAKVAKPVAKKSAGKASG